MGKIKKWVRNSIDSFVLDSTFNGINSYKNARLAYKKKASKHTFFPGNEIFGSRISLENQYIIDDDLFFKIIWDIVIMLVTITITYLIPYSVSFYSDYSRDLWLIISIIFLFDTLLTFNTSYFAQGVRVTDRKLIALNYLKSWFIVDFFSSLPLELCFYGQFDYQANSLFSAPKLDKSNYRYLLLLKLLRIFKYKQLIFKVQELYSNQFTNKVTSVLSYFLAVSLPLHFMACLFNKLYCQSLLETFENYDKLIEDTWSRYLKFFLRAIQTMTSVGYGDFTVKTNTEKIMIMIMMAMTSGLLGYFVGSFQSEIEKSNQTSHYFQAMTRKTKLYCKRNSIPSELRERIVNYIRNLKQIYTENLIKEQDILNLLSSPMREEIFSYIRGHFLMRIDDFNYLSTTCLRSICYSLKLQMFGPNDLIVKQGELTNDLYFLVAGNLEVFHCTTKTVFKFLSKSAFFGEISFFTNSPRSASVKSYNYSEVLIFRQIDFNTILQSLPADKEKINTLKRNLSIYGLSVLKLRCYLCLKIGHVAINCNKYIIHIKNINPIPSGQNLKRMEPNFFRKNVAPNTLTRYNLRSAKGVHVISSKLFANNQFLTQSAERYSSWAIGMGKKTSHIMSLISINAEISCHSESESQESEVDSYSSRENFLNFEMTRTKRFSAIFSGEQLFTSMENGEDSLKRPSSR
ncbi:hypothetical protein SteCoe_28101 [Stentor coeruleus]|uniref:Cyclic nucleotide-binding domain-containing protein n=1 Tax=Stentor coeruleus TaxID=5963 RepID=A0A1R2B912_9CILI|nr:hypothetical protein SteCoe_28101 [Stentor coeruleus]